MNFSACSHFGVYGSRDTEEMPHSQRISFIVSFILFCQQFLVKNLYSYFLITDILYFHSCMPPIKGSK